MTLAPFCAAHLTDRYVSWLNDPEVVRFSEQRHRAHTLDTCLAYVAGSEWLRAIEVDGRHVGNISAALDRHNGTADIGILLGDRAHWGRGVGTAAWRQAMAQLFAEGFRKVTAGTMAANVRMLGIMRQTMVIEARRRGQFLLDGKPVDAVYGAAFRGR